jgi:hypothetical protein
LSKNLKVTGEWYFYENGILIKQEKNLIVQSGLSFLAALFIAEQQNDIPFHLAIGTGTNAAASGDTKLQAEAFRKAVSAKQRQGSMVRLRTFLLNNECNGNFNEFAIFIAGTDAADSGTMFNRLVTPVSKTQNTVLTIETRITFSAG